MSSELFNVLPFSHIEYWEDPDSEGLIYAHWFASGIHFGNMIYPVESFTYAICFEGIGTMYEKQRLLFQGAQYPDGDTNLLPYLTTSALTLRIGVHEAISLDNRQFLVTFDVESPTPNKAQLFLGDEMELDFDVQERRLASVLFDPLIGFNFVTLRPQKSWLYYYSVQVTMIE